MMRIHQGLIALIVVALSTASGLAQQGFQDRQERGDHDDGAYAIGLWGDTPYSDTQAAVGVPNLIADMNRHHVAFSVHDGDLKTGNGASICVRR